MVLAHDTHHDAVIVELSNGLLRVADTGAAAGVDEPVRGGRPALSFSCTS